jgi:tetratricopeptide (TPR) repeat protein
MKTQLLLLLTCLPLVLLGQSRRTADQQQLTEYNRLLSLNPADYHTFYNRSVVRYRLGDLDGACEDIYQGLGLLGKSTADVSLVAKLKARSAKYCDPAKSGYYYRRGRSFFELGQYTESIAAYQQGLEKFPQDAWLLISLADAYLAAGEYTAAIQYNEKALTVEEIPPSDLGDNDPDGIQTEAINWSATAFRAAIEVRIASAYLGLGELETALARINQSISTARTTREYGLENDYLVRGHIYLALGKPDAARQDFTQCLNLHPDFEPAYVGRALCALLPEKAVFAGFSILDSQSLNAYGARWEFPLASKRDKTETAVQLALQDIEKAIALQAADGYAYFVRGQLRQLLDEPGHCSDFYKAIETGYLVGVDFFHDCGVNKQ